jgi:Mg2+-importing ATPase
VFHAHAPLFRSGWFVESLATQSLLVLLIRTRRVPVFHSPPSRPLLATTLLIVAIGIAIPYSPLAHALGFRALPLLFLVILGGMTVTYLGLVELGKRRFFRGGELRFSRNTSAGGRGCEPDSPARHSKPWQRLPRFRARSSTS